MHKLFTLFIILVSLLMPLPLHAAEQCNASYPAAAVLRLVCEPGYATPRDTLTIYAVDGPFDQARPWQENLNDEDAFWVFDAGDQGRASVIIRFRREGTALIAELYDDSTDDGQVSYRLDNGLPQIAESQYPTVQLKAPAGWWQREGQINYNLEVAVDGAVEVTFASIVFVEFLSNNGEIDYKLQIYDRNNDGRPDYELRNAYPPIDERWDQYRNIYRSILIASEGPGDEPITKAIFWPFLGSGSSPADQPGTLPPDRPYDPQGRDYGTVKAYNESLPPIQVDWANARIRHVGEFVASHGSDQNWYIESKERIEPGQENSPNFENPFGFYDLAGDRDGVPEMQIRIEYNVPNDYFLFPNFDQPANMVRYSWDQDNNQSWDFKVDLLGRHEYTAAVELPNTTVRTVPYKELPEFISERAWDSVGFVAVESEQPYRGTEGIYESLGATIYARNDLITGRDDEPPPPDEANWPLGLRGEFNDLMSGPVRVYISPVDGKLHLDGANAGLWKLNERESIRYRSLGGKQIDSWALVEGASSPKKLLLEAGEYLVYTDGNEVRIASAQRATSPTSVPPPRTPAEWRSLGAQLEQSARTHQPDDFAAMVATYGPLRERISGAQVRDLRPQGAGFRFVLSLAPGFEQLKSSGLQLGERVPGDYLVSFDGQRYSIEPLSASVITLNALAGPLNGAEPGAVLPIYIEVENRSGTDSPPLQLIAEARSQSGNTIIGEQPITVTLRAGEPARLDLIWQPAAAGQWQIEVRLVDAQQQIVARSEQEVLIAPAPAGLRSNLFIYSTFAIIGLLALSVGLALLISRRELRLRQTQPTEARLVEPIEAAPVKEKNTP